MSKKNTKLLIIIIVKTNLIYQKYINKFYKKLLFNIAFLVLITLEYTIMMELSLPYLYIFRIIKLFIAITCVVPNFLKWGSPSFRHHWDIVERYLKNKSR